MFFVGAGLLLAAMSWWLWVLLASWHGWPFVEQPVPVGWMHGILMQYATLPPFVMGFLLTVFPRWMSVPVIPRIAYGSIFGLLLSGALLVLASAIGLPRLLPAGLGVMLLGWILADGILAERLYRHNFRDIWALSSWCALAIGTIGLSLIFSASLGAPMSWVPGAIHIATFGLLLPVYFTVAHRMVPFFSSNVIEGYHVRRPAWSLAAVWILSLGHGLLDLLGEQSMRWVFDTPMTMLLLWQWLSWQPWKATRPGLLLVLYIALSWLPLSFALYALDDLNTLLTGTASRALGPLHALTVGFFSSMLVAMVTRVTQGHSGQPLRMNAVAWIAFIGIQMVAIARVMAEYFPSRQPLYIASASLWILCLLPWVSKSLRTYIRPRHDGSPG